MASSTYHYTPLSDPNNFRLFRLIPCGSPTTTVKIEGRLENRNIYSCPPYTAISYVWGKDPPSLPIQCDGESLLVTQSCLDLLMELAQANTEQFLWIDAICINQKDIEERNQQVAIMEQIYSTAEEVTIWLGQSDPASDEAMTLLERLNYDGSESQENIISKLIDGQIDGPYGHLPYGLVGVLLTREWFERTWTVQEAVLGPEDAVWLRCGSRRLQFEKFVSELGAIMEYEDKYDFDHFHTFRTFWTLKTEFLEELRLCLSEANGQPPRFEKLTHMLMALSFRKATDARDKVFGAFGIFKRLYWDVPKPDYKKDTDVVYTEVTQREIEIDQSLLVLEAVGGSRSTPKLPSWVPDYKKGCAFNGGDWENWISACCHTALRYSFSADGRKLTVYGQVLDMIEIRGSSIPWDEEVGHLAGPEKENLQNIATDIIKTWRDLAFTIQEPSRCSEPLEDQFAITLYRAGLAERTVEQALDLWSVFISLMEELDDDHYMDFSANLIEPSLGVLSGNCNLAFVITAGGRMATVPQEALPSDILIAVAGYPAPFVIRPSPDGETWTIIGAAYLHGVMKGEAWDKEAELQPFTLV